MKSTSFSLKGLFLGLLLSAGFLGSFSPAFAQGEVEPNNTCAEAQDLGVVTTFPIVVEGSLDQPDVDFFRFTGTPGAVIRVDLEGEATGKGTLADPDLELYDSNCNFLVWDGGSGSGENARLIFVIPADGVFVVKAYGWESGTYQLTITPTSAIGSVSGRIVDALTGAPLSGVAAPYAWATLYVCEDPTCAESDWVNGQNADSDGRFTFTSDDLGSPLEVGTYLLVAYADQYIQGQTDPFYVRAEEARNVGDVRLQPFPFQFSDIVPCNNIPAEGGTCSYSAKLTNHSGTLLDGAAWSKVFGYGIGSLIDYTRFQTENPQQLTLRPGASKVVKFRFDVPSTARDDAFMCAEAWAGQDRLYPFFNTVAENSYLFCIQKEPAGAFSVMPAKKAHQIFRKLNKRSLIPLKRK